MTEMNEELITIPEMAERLKISRVYAYELKRRAGFPFYNFGVRQTRVLWSEVSKWVEENCKFSEKAI